MRAYRVPFALGSAGTLCEDSVSWSWLIWNYISQNPLFHVVGTTVEKREVGVILPKNASGEIWRSPERC